MSMFVFDGTKVSVRLILRKKKKYLQSVIKTKNETVYFCELKTELGLFGKTSVNIKKNQHLQ